MAVLVAALVFMLPPLHHVWLGPVAILGCHMHGTPNSRPLPQLCVYVLCLSNSRGGRP